MVRVLYRRIHPTEFFGFLFLAFYFVLLVCLFSRIRPKGRIGRCLIFRSRFLLGRLLELRTPRESTSNCSRDTSTIFHAPNRSYPRCLLLRRATSSDRAARATRRSDFAMALGASLPADCSYGMLQAPSKGTPLDPVGNRPTMGVGCLSIGGGGSSSSRSGRQDDMPVAKAKQTDAGRAEMAMVGRDGGQRDRNAPSDPSRPLQSRERLSRTDASISDPASSFLVLTPLFSHVQSPFGIAVRRSNLDGRQARQVYEALDGSSVRQY